LTASTTSWWWLPSSDYTVTRLNTSDIPSHHLLLLLCQSAGVDREQNQLLVAIIDFTYTFVQPTLTATHIICCPCTYTCV
jgi:hypothetical protein